MDKIEKLAERIFKAVLLNYDEKILFPYTRCYSLLIDDNAGFEIPASLELPEGAFVDELWFDDGSNTVDLCFSVMNGECSERIDEIDILDLDEEYLERLVSYAESHKGSHIVD